MPPIPIYTHAPINPKTASAKADGVTSPTTAPEHQNKQRPTPTRTAPPSTPQQQRAPLASAALHKFSTSPPPPQAGAVPVLAPTTKTAALGAAPSQQQQQQQEQQAGGVGAARARSSSTASLEHPSGYMQNPYAADGTALQRAVLEDAAAREKEEAGSTGVLGIIGGLFASAGEQLKKADREAWRLVGGAGR